MSSIMQPGMWHSVYMPIGTMTLGGHFLTYNTLHLMHNAYVYDDSELPKCLQSVSTKMCCDLSTNESQSVDRQVMQMVLALPITINAKGRCWSHFCS